MEELILLSWHAACVLGANILTNVHVRQGAWAIRVSFCRDQHFACYTSTDNTYCPIAETRIMYNTNLSRRVVRTVMQIALVKNRPSERTLRTGLFTNGAFCDQTGGELSHQRGLVLHVWRPSMMLKFLATSRT